MHEVFHLAALLLLILIHLVLQENSKGTVSYSLRTMRNLWFTENMFSLNDTQHLKVKDIQAILIIQRVKFLNH